MKKFLFLLLAVACFSSCNNDSTNGVDPVAGKTYPVTFDIQGGFASESNPIGVVTRGGGVATHLNYAIYNASGAKVLQNGKDVTTPASLSITEELPAGTYKIAVVYANEAYADAGTKFVANSFTTDKFLQNMDGTTNVGHYLKVADFTVAEGINPAIAMELKPMWSEFKIVIDDKATCTFPVGTEKIKLVLAPQTTAGFTIAGGKGVQVNASLVYSITYTTAQIKSLAHLGADFIVSQSDASELKLVYLKADGTTSVGQRIIYSGAWESAQDITFTGSLGGGIVPPTDPTQGFTITLGNLVPVNKPFQP